MSRSTARIGLAALFAVALGMTGAPRKHYSPREKAFYADAATVDFVRPGLVIKINSAAVAADGTITTLFSITDPQGLPLDAAGITTPGVVSLSFIAAFIPKNQDQYVAYTTRTATGAVLASATQAAVDSGGVMTPVGAGYQYVFKTKAPAGFDATATHTIGIYGNRNLTLFNLGTNRASTTYNFVPNGIAVTRVRDVIEDASCNRCHDQLSHHGGNRRGMAMCVLCHTPQTTDAVTGNTVDMKVMIHKIHMGKNLPSVIAGKPYKVSSSDFSAVAFPADPFDPRRCEVCHSQTTGAKQATAYLTNPTRAVCGACHDDVNFATGAAHVGGPQFDDNLCATCHIPQGEIDFDASIKGAHVVPTASSLLTGLAVNFTNVANGGAGGKPTLTFTVKDGSGKPLPLSQLSSLSLTMAGPTTQYGYTSFGSDVTTPGYVTESALTAANCGADGTCTYTFTHPLPAKATGTYAVGVEARRTEVVLPGTTIQQSITYGAPNKVVYFSADGSLVAPRRQVVAIDSCNQCHVSLQVHGGLRNNTEYCVMCHNPSNTDAARRVSAADKATPPQGINFNLLVHRIHDGINMQASNRTFVVVGFGGSHNDFSGTLFPALTPTGNPLDLANCAMCHVKGSEQNLVGLSGLGPVTDPQGPINPNQPIASACSGCHLDIPSASHMLSMTTPLGESCDVCHGTVGAGGVVPAFSVGQVHAQY